MCQVESAAEAWLAFQLGTTSLWGSRVLHRPAPLPGCPKGRSFAALEQLHGADRALADSWSELWPGGRNTCVLNLRGPAVRAAPIRAALGLPEVRLSFSATFHVDCGRRLAISGVPFEGHATHYSLMHPCLRAAQRL